MIGELPGEDPPLLDRQRQRLPAQCPTQLDQRRHQRQARGHNAWVIEQGGRAQGRQIEHTVGVLHDALQPVLAQHDGQPQILVEVTERDEHLLGRLRIELRGRLVQHQHFGLQRQHRSKRHALLLAAGKRADAPAAQVRDAHLIQHLFDALAHGGRRQGEVFHGERQLILHRVHHKLRLGILKDKAHQIRHAARGQRGRVAAEYVDLSRPPAAVEMRHQSVEAAQKGRFARARRPHHQHKLAGLDRRREIGQRRRGLVGVGVGDVVELDQAS